MLLNLTIGCALVALSAVVHAGAMLTAIHGLRISHARVWARESAFTRVSVISFLVLIMFAASLIEALMWAATYMALGAISGVEKAVYFSIVTYTTLGYGDITLDEGWRVFSTLEAIDGIMMFGWTTALLVATVQRVYFPRRDEAKLDV